MRCLMVDDNAGFLAAARKLLESGGLTIVGVASSSDEAVRLFDELRPDVTLVDIDLGTESGLDLVERLHQTGAPSAAILISAHSEEDFQDPIANSSAVGFVAKSELSSDAIRDLVSGSAGLQEGDHR